MSYWNKINKKCTCILGLVLLSGLFVGCTLSKEPEKQVDAAIIMGVHANAPQIQFSANTANEIDGILFDVSSSYGNVYYIRCDGDPEIYFAQSINPPSTGNLSKAKLKTIAESNTDGLRQQLFNENALAVCEEVDTLGALSIAADSLSTVEGDREKRIFIADSGLSTCNYLDFTKYPILNINKDELIEKLMDSKAIPDLTGVKLDWFFMGATADPQEELSEKQLSALREIWSMILDASGADYKIHKDILTGEAYEGLPFVSEIQAEEKTISLEAYVEELEEKEDIIAVLMDAEEGVKFNGNKSTFVDEVKAREKIKEVADFLNQKENEKIEILVIGTTANITSKDLSFFLELSQNRADVVMQVLGEYGVAPERMDSIGLGYKDIWYQDDIDPSTERQIEEIAALNRKCVIVDKNSDSAKESMDRYHQLMD